MPVVIDDFQVVAEPSTGEGTAVPAPAEPVVPSPPSPREIERILERRAVRLARVRAH